ncbi:MAG: PIG-L deacetylase family protein [Planctomycetota bacterium]
MKEEFEFVRLVGDERRAGATLQSVSRHWQGNKECFLFISPHDDDAAIGAGLLIQLAKRENVPVHIVIVTDGSMGYCTLDEKEEISGIRRKEAFECYQSLDVPKENIVWLGFPACYVDAYRGRHPASADDKVIIKGFTGLQNAFTYHLRKIRPTQCFLPTSKDLHPTHRIIHEEFLISLFHASGAIWPELGEPLEKTPYAHEIAVYCDFPEPPQLKAHAPVSFLERKLKAIAAFRSQKQISSIIDIVKHAGPEEYIKALEFKLYNPGRYKDLFEEKGMIDFTHR